MYRSILVPLDGSPFAEHALPFARTIARRAGAKLDLVTVSTPLSEAFVEGLYFSTYDLEQETTARHQQYLEATARRLREKSDVVVTYHVLQGDISTCLCDHILHGKADLVVMATHGRGALGRMWLGSVADEMLRHTPAPLLLVRPETTAVDLETEPDLSKMVLPLDGSPLAEQILEPATAFVATIPGGEILLVRAIHSAATFGARPDTVDAGKEARALTEQVHQMQARLREEAERYLAEVAGRLRSKGLHVRTRVVAEEHPAVAILQETASEGAGVIAIETHGRRGLSRLILGSVADKVVRGAHVPVLIHRPRG